MLIHALLGHIRQTGFSERPFLQSAGASKSRLSRISDGNPMANPKRKPGRRNSKSETGKKSSLSGLMCFSRRWGEARSHRKRIQELVSKSCRLRCRCCREMFHGKEEKHWLDLQNLCDKEKLVEFYFQLNSLLSAHLACAMHCHMNPISRV
ncbi:hypothetical protein AVEN_215055-1 [Araneus ventricosus]|uniref:Uncharacterized protein n=1 Tax=Araneus ventricosus TaxID=182803 RepID=A0A4Y2Q7H6_ARAVE|nr:hypothetical protein AVEN_215055-1 [Araneus ventricosus]